MLQLKMLMLHFLTWTSLWCLWRDNRSGMHVQWQPLGGRCETPSALLQPAGVQTQDEAACQEVCHV